MARRTTCALIGVALLVAGCTGDDPADDAQPTTTQTPTTSEATTTTALSDEAQLRQLVSDWSQAAPRIFGEGGDVSEAGAYLAGQYLQQIGDQFDDYKSRGVLVRGSDRSQAEIESIEVSDDAASLVECITDADVLVDGATGELLDDDVSTYRTHTSAVRTERGWRLSVREVQATFEGEASCDAG